MAYYRDEPFLNAIADFPTDKNNSASLKFKKNSRPNRR